MNCAGLLRLALQASQCPQICSSSSVIAGRAKQSILQEPRWIASSCVASLAMTVGLFIVLCHCGQSEAIHSARTALDCFVLRCKPRNDRRFVHPPLALLAEPSNPFCQNRAGLLRLALQASQ